MVPGTQNDRAKPPGWRERCATRRTACFEMLDSVPVQSVAA
jgi:hypothetical protein